MERNEYIESFFNSLKSQLNGATIAKDGKSAKYQNLIVSANWSNELWEVQVHGDTDEQIQRQFDPGNARSSQAAANYFVDALRRIRGEEPLPRPPVMHRNFRGAGRGASK
ncbi:MAG TPA: hypothetical protein VKR99_04820 [Candidatus Eremiobacteraceae bacterium]|nr:hypothetical protein [Candidatus Eremiobacteraceae bacterium]